MDIRESTKSGMCVLCVGGRGLVTPWGQTFFLRFCSPSILHLTVSQTQSLSLLHTQMGLLSMHGAFRCSHNLCHSHARKCDQKVVCGCFKRGRICWISLWHGGCCMAYEKIVCADQPSVLPLLETHANCRKWSDSTWKVTNTWNY